MGHISAHELHQVSFSLLEEHAGSGDPVRFRDAFVEKLQLPKLYFQNIKLRHITEYGKTERSGNVTEEFNPTWRSCSLSN